MAYPAVATRVSDGTFIARGHLREDRGARICNRSQLQSHVENFQRSVRNLLFMQPSEPAYMYNDDSRDSMATEENSRQSLNTKYAKVNVSYTTNSQFKCSISITFSSKRYVRTCVRNAEVGTSF